VFSVTGKKVRYLHRRSIPGFSGSIVFMNKRVVYSVFFFLSMMLFSCENSIKEINALQSKSTQVETAENIRLIYSQAANVKAVVTAPELISYLTDTPHVVLDKGVRAQFYDDSLHVQSVLTAKTADYNEDNNEIEVRDSVVVVNKKGEKLECQELHWDAQKQKFISNTSVKITTPTQLIYGNGLEASADFTWYKVIQVKNSNIKVNENDLPGK
jgi:lipopolysaccharide export system protein LptC